MNLNKYESTIVMGVTKKQLEEILAGLKETLSPEELVKHLGLEKRLSQQSLLSDTGILREIEKGNIVIHPYDKRNLSTASYDVTLGPYYYRERDSAGSSGLLNPYDENKVRKIWKEHEAKTMRMECSEREITDLGGNIHPEDRVIIVAPGETILAHTAEFIGGRNSVTWRSWILLLRHQGDCLSVGERGTGKPVSPGCVWLNATTIRRCNQDYFK